MNKLIQVLLIVWLMMSCNYDEQDVRLDIASANGNGNGNGGSSSANYVSFHFIRFNLVTNGNNDKSYLPTLKKLAKDYNGLTLTDGSPSTCAENYCRDTNIILAFQSITSAADFFDDFQVDFAEEIANRFDDLSYVALNDFGFLTSPNISTLKGFLIAEGDITNDSIFFNHYAPAAGATIDDYGGHRLWKLDSGYQECLIGSCADFHAVVGFSLFPTLNNWYYSEVYQSLIPLRNSITANDGTVLTK